MKNIQKKTIQNNTSNTTQNTNINSYFFWGLLGVLYFAFVMIFSFLYPEGKDEILTYKVKTFPIAWKAIKLMYANQSPRIGQFLANYIGIYGKSLFIFLNPIMHLSIVISMFYFIHLRLPNLKTLKDFPTFLLLVVMATFMTGKPDNTMFWIGGSITYSWPMILYFCFLSFLRKELKFSHTNNISLFYSIMLIIWGFCVGTINENTSPMAFCILIAFILWMLYSKKRFSKQFYLLALGLTIGVIFFFASPGMYARAQTPQLQKFIESSLLTKIFFHIYKINDITIALLLIPILVPFSIILRGVALKKEFLKNENLILSTICCLVAWGLAMVLCVAPLVPDRAFYSSCLMFICAFIFLLLDLKDFCSFNLIKTLTFFLTLWFMMLMPIFINSYLYLYNRYNLRLEHIAKTKAKGEKTIYLQMIYNLRVFPKNLSTLYYDPLGYYTFYENYLHLKIDSDIPKEDRTN